MNTQVIWTCIPNTEVTLYMVCNLSQIKWSVHDHNSMNVEPINSAPLAADRCYLGFTHLCALFTIFSYCMLWPINSYY